MTPAPLTTVEVDEFLKAYGLDRQWLAERIGAASGTFRNWCGKSEFPLWAEKSIRLVMDAKASNSQRDTGEWKFTLAEYRELEAARAKAGSATIEEFILMAAKEAARQLIAQSSKSSNNDEKGTPGE